MTPNAVDTADSLGATEKDQVKGQAKCSLSAEHPVQRSFRTGKPPIRYGLYAYVSEKKSNSQDAFKKRSLDPKKLWLATMALEMKPPEAVGTSTIVVGH